MARRLCVAMALLGLVAGTVVVQAQSQPNSMPMSGMDHAMNKPAPSAGPLKITFGGQSAEWTPATLAALPHTTITVHNPHLKAEQTYSGVPLMDLLVKVGVPPKPHAKDFQLYLTVTGSDGYEVVYSLGEISPYMHDTTVIVADTEDGKPLAGDGPLKLIATQDKAPERWVRNLVAIQVLRAE